MAFILVQEKATLFKVRTLHAYCSWGAASGYHTHFYCFEIIHIRDKSLFSVITEFMPTGTLHTSKEIKTLILKVDGKNF